MTGRRPVGCDMTVVVKKDRPLVGLSFFMCFLAAAEGVAYPGHAYVRAFEDQVVSA